MEQVPCEHLNRKNLIKMPLTMEEERYRLIFLLVPVFTRSTHLGKTNLSLFFNTSAYAAINFGAATSLTVMLTCFPSCAIST